MADDPDDTRALFQRVIDNIRQRIGTGSMGPDEQLPGAAQLASDYGYAHMTIQRALQELKRDGLIYSVKGKGTFVHPKARERMRQQAEAAIPTGPITIDTEEQYRAIVDGYNARLSAALDEAEAAVASGEPERIKAIDASLDQVYLEISPAVAAAHLYFLRQMHGFGFRVKPTQLELPDPGLPTYNWAHFGNPNATDDEIDAIIRRRQPKKSADQPPASDNDSPDT